MRSEVKPGNERAWRAKGRAQRAVRKKSGIDIRSFSAHQIGAEDIHMTSSSLLLAPAVVADIPPPYSPASPIGLVILLAVCAAAFFGLRALFRRRSKNAAAKSEAVTKE